MPDSSAARLAVVRMLGALALVGSLLVSVPAARAQQQANFDGAGYERAIATILCDCGCHPQSVKECACGRAAQMRDEMRAMVASGMSGDQVIASYVEKHGEQILISPKAEGFNLIAWLGPLAALFVAIGGMTWLVRRWSLPRAADRALDAQDAPPPVPPAADEGRYLDRLRRDLEERQ